MNKLNRLYKFEDMSNEDVLLNNGFQNVNQLIDYSNSLKEEIERLNNIINELEEETRCGYYEYSSSDGDYIEGYDDGASKTADFFNKMIKELRGNKVDKEDI